MRKHVNCESRMRCLQQHSASSYAIAWSAHRQAVKDFMVLVPPATAAVPLPRIFSLWHSLLRLAKWRRAKAAVEEEAVNRCSNSIAQRNPPLGWMLNVNDRELLACLAQQRAQRLIRAEVPNVMKELEREAVRLQFGTVQQMPPSYGAPASLDDTKSLRVR